jgi:hypothetical protein
VLDYMRKGDLPNFHYGQGWPQFNASSSILNLVPLRIQLKDFMDEQAKINKDTVTKFKVIHKVLENWKDLAMPRGGWIGSIQISETNAVVKTLVGTTDVVPELPRGLGTSGTRSVLPTRQRRLKQNLKTIAILAILFESKS